MTTPYPAADDPRYTSSFKEPSNARVPNSGAIPPEIRPPLDILAPREQAQQPPSPMTPLTDMGYTASKGNNVPDFAQINPSDPRMEPVVRTGYTAAPAPLAQRAVPYEEQFDTGNTYKDEMPGPNKSGRQFGPPVAEDAMLGPPPPAQPQLDTTQRTTHDFGSTQTGGFQPLGDSVTKAAGHAPQAQGGPPPELVSEVAHEAADKARHVTPAGKEKAAEDAHAEGAYPGGDAAHSGLVSQKIQELTGQGSPNASSAQATTPVEQVKAKVAEAGGRAQEGVRQTAGAASSAAAQAQQSAAPVIDQLKATFTGAKQQAEGGVQQALSSGTTRDVPSSEQVVGTGQQPQQAAGTVWDKTVNLMTQGKQVVAEQASKVGDMVQQAVGSPRAAGAQTRGADLEGRVQANVQATEDQAGAAASKVQQSGATAAQKAQEAAALALHKAQEMAAAATAAAQKYSTAAVQGAQQTGDVAAQKVNRDVQPAVGSGIAGWKDAVVNTVSDIAKQREHWYQEYEKDVHPEDNADRPLQTSSQVNSQISLPEGVDQNAQDIAAQMYRKGYEKGLREAGIKPEDASSGHLLGTSTVSTNLPGMEGKPLLPSPDGTGMATRSFAVPVLEDVIDVNAVNDVVMWRNPAKSAAVLAGGTVTYFLLAWSRMNLLPIVAWTLLLALVGTAVWNNVVRLAKRPHLQVLTTYRQTSDSHIYNTVAPYRRMINRMFATLYRGMQGMYWLDTAKVLGVLYIFRRFIPFLTSPGLLYFSFLLAFCIPKFYDAHRTDIDAALRHTKEVAREQYCEKVEPLIERVPKASTAKPLDVGQPCRRKME